MRYPGESTTGEAPGRRQSPSGRSAPGRQGPAPAEQAARSDPSVFAPGYSGGRAAGRGSSRAAARAGTGQYGSTGGAAGKGPVRGFPPAPGQPPPLYPPGQFSAWNRTSRHNPGPASGAWQALGSTAGAVAGQAGAGPAGLADGDRGRAGQGHAYPGYADGGYAGPGSADAGYSDRGYADAGYDEPGYSALAVSDPAADVTSTQTWGAVDGSPATSGWDSAATSGWSDLSGPRTGPRRAALPHTDPHQLPLPRTESGREAMLPGAAYGAGAAAADLAGDLAAADLAAGGMPTAGMPGAGAAVPRQGWPHAGEDAPGPEWEPAHPDTAGSAPRTGPYSRTAAYPRTRTGRGAAGRADGDLRRGRGASGAGTGTRPSAPPGRGQGTRGRGNRGRGRPRAQRRPGFTLVASVLAVIVVAGAGGYLWFSGHHSNPAAAVSPQQAATPGTSPGAAASPATSPGPWGDIVSRAADPAPLTLAELFPAQFTNGATSYTKTVQQARRRCPGALIGSQLIAAVKKAGCSQAMRASYLSSDQKMMGTIGVLNLITAAAAKRAGRAAGPTEFIAQLPGTSGPTKRLTKGTGIEAAEIKGHYLVLVWAEFANLRPPRSPAQRQDLETFISLLIQKTANVTLATRMVTGKPAS